MKIIEEFKTFAMRGNVIDLAVGVVIGGAFGKIVSSLVADIITPTIGILAGGIDFSKLGYTLHNLRGEEVTIKYGNFLQTMFDFVIIAFSIFIFIKILNKAQEKVIKKDSKNEKKESPKKTDDIIILEEIRDLLKQNKTAVKATKTQIEEPKLVEKPIRKTSKKIINKDV